MTKLETVEKRDTVIAHLWGVIANDELFRAYLHEVAFEAMTKVGFGGDEEKAKAFFDRDDFGDYPMESATTREELTALDVYNNARQREDVNVLGTMAAETSDDDRWFLPTDPITGDYEE